MSKPDDTAWCTFCPSVRAVIVISEDGGVGQKMRLCKECARIAQSASGIGDTLKALLSAVANGHGVKS